MDLRKKPNGRWELRWREAGCKRGRRLTASATPSSS